FLQNCRWCGHLRELSLCTFLRGLFPADHDLVVRTQIQECYQGLEAPEERPPVQLPPKNANIPRIRSLDPLPPAAIYGRPGLLGLGIKRDQVQPTNPGADGVIPLLVASQPESAHPDLPIGLLVLGKEWRAAIAGG